jgi:hypothetical protein
VIAFTANPHLKPTSSHRFQESHSELRQPTRYPPHVRLFLTNRRQCGIIIPHTKAIRHAVRLDYLGSR